MKTKSPWLSPIDRPRLTLAIYWVCWKTVLLLVALSSPGNGYDTSTAVLFAQYEQEATQSKYTDLVQHALQKLVRWDAVYFTQVAHRGTRFEQEWAFGWGFTRLLNLGGIGTGIVVEGENSCADGLRPALVRICRFVVECCYRRNCHSSSQSLSICIRLV